VKVKKAYRYLVPYTEKTTRHGESRCRKTWQQLRNERQTKQNLETVKAATRQSLPGQDSDDERPIAQTLNKGQPKFGLLR
jgi:hypothetical protein